MPASKGLLDDLKGKRGYLPYQMIEAACQQGYIHSEVPIAPSQLQPVSLDLRLGPKAYRIQCSFLPENDTVEEKLKDVKLYEFDISGDGGILEKGAIYLIPLMEALNFPSAMFGLANPKSSTGRLDMFTRVIIDHGHRFDEIRKEYKGKLYLEIIPRSFPVKVKAGLTLNQLRIGYVASATLGNQGLEPEYKNNPILFDGNGFAIPYNLIKIKEGIYISVELSGKGENVIAYKAKTNSSVIDLSKINHYRAEDFWEPIYRTRNDRLILEPECFYIMMSKEKICIAPNLLAEMVAYEPNSGELRTHYAGFFDPGFGWAEDEPSLNLGTPAVMEVRPHDVPFMVEDGQTFCRLKFDKVIATPKKIYGKEIKSNYHSQGLALSKYFKK
ncbi:MAG: 2'-deoxycytidine 5'-triphosphate deaminase [Nitrospinaceae bacterium]|nr:MAG: 2'-deoxycytidine 5'-triphosphate deaminase [Nitrospinaceae bacterium]